MTLLIDGIKYSEWIPKREDEFEDMVVEHSGEIFGESSIYFDLKRKIVSKAKIASIPDGYVMIFSDPPRWYVVENELSTHPVYEHIVPQLAKFINGIRESRSQREIVESLYREITSNEITRAIVQKHIGSREVYHFLSNLVSGMPTVVVIVDEKTPEILEACQSLPASTDVVEFKTFAREGVGISVHAHLFEPLFAPRLPPQPKDKVTKEEKRPPHRKDWYKRLEWTTPSAKKLVSELTDRILKAFPTVSHLPKNRWYYFYKGDAKTSASLFAVFLLKKTELKVRIKFDANQFKDVRNWTRKYKGWFFKKTEDEREFTVNSPDQFDYAMDLISQSYKIAE